MWAAAPGARGGPTYDIRGRAGKGGPGHRVGVAFSEGPKLLPFYENLAKWQLLPFYRKHTIFQSAGVQSSQVRFPQESAVKAARTAAVERAEAAAARAAGARAEAAAASRVC